MTEKENQRDFLLTVPELERNWPAGPRRPGRRQAVYDSSGEAVTAVEGFWGH